MGLVVLQDFKYERINTFFNEVNYKKNKIITHAMEILTQLMMQCLAGSTNTSEKPLQLTTPEKKSRGLNPSPVPSPISLPQNNQSKYNGMQECMAYGDHSQC